MLVKGCLIQYVVGVIGTSLNNDVIINKIKTKFKEIIRINFQNHLRQETLKTLKKNFAIK